MSIKHELLPAHQDKRNKAWFDLMFSAINLGGELRTSTCVYVKTATGFKPKQAPLIRTKLF